MKVLEIDKHNIENINYDTIIAVTVAESGAMGEPNCFQVVDKDMQLYHSNLVDGQVSYDELVKKFPVLKGFNCGCDQINKLNVGWKWFNLGGGNVLLVKDEYYKAFNNAIITHLGKNYKKSDLYLTWYDILKYIISDVK